VHYRPLKLTQDPNPPRKISSTSTGDRRTTRKVLVGPRGAEWRRPRRAGRQDRWGAERAGARSGLGHGTGWGTERAGARNGLGHGTGWGTERAGARNGLGHGTVKQRAMRLAWHARNRSGRPTRPGLPGPSPPSPAGTGRARRLRASTTAGRPAPRDRPPARGSRRSRRHQG
jgi:hypothetical protein